MKSVCPRRSRNFPLALLRVTNQSVTGIGQADHLVRIFNDSPGVGDLTVTVNGQNFKVHGLGDGQQATLDIAGALHADNNSVSLTTTGKPGGSAALLFGNI